ncbi:hypothetical protein LZK98_17195 [Sphingomonas cannabina]|uniref:hypothetical protein n=1 Tax=Sphingomonas cannabina TaxID=2899123 RepID=UPI001F372CF5|nr:hypothetical protein [Sphingomonas cannabina]UIJ44771.1 hypothetical protein LZK98_17195 [Sphingomonas cannabina]
MKAIVCALACASCVVSFDALAQTAAPAPVQSTPIVAGAPADNVLRVGTPLQLRMMEELTTKGKKLKVGQRFNMETAEALSLGDTVVIPAGSPAVGEITDVRNKGMWGKSGRINVRALYVRVNGRQIRLTGATDDKGVTGTAGVVASVALVPVVGFFVTGTSAKIGLGSQMKAFLDEDVPVTFSGGAPAPLVVPATTGTPAPAPAPAPGQTAS